MYTSFSVVGQNKLVMNDMALNINGIIWIFKQLHKVHKYCINILKLKKKKSVNIVVTSVVRKTTSMTVPTVKRVTRDSKTIRHPTMHRVYTLVAELPHPTIHREIKNLLGGGRLGNARYLWAEPRRRGTPSSQWESPVMTSWLFLERLGQQIR